MIDRATEARDIFQMVGWGNSTGHFHSPPLTDPDTGGIAMLPAEKRDLLVQTLLQKAACVEDIPIVVGRPAAPRIPAAPRATTEPRAPRTLNTYTHTHTHTLRLVWLISTI